MRDMKKTTLSIFVVGLFIIGSFAAIGNGKNASTNNETTIPLEFSAPSIAAKAIERQTYELLTVGGAPAAYYHAGQPILPMYTTTMTFPFGTDITQVDFQVNDIKTMAVSNKIVPAPQPQILGTDDNTIQYTMDDTIYRSTDLFPGTWVSYYTGAGLDSNNEHATFLTIQVYPVQYSPATNTLNYAQNGVLTISYVKPKTSPFPAATTYDLVIIAPKKFSSALQPLIDEKISHGITTTLKTTEDIYTEYTGVDKPEQIKYFIKDAMETWGAKYIMLVGGLDSMITGSRKDDRNQGSQDWLVPVRYTNLRESGDIYDPGYVSDLYYADIYTSNGSFSSWDTNHDGIFANWPVAGTNKDVLDLYPDIAVGRLPCRNTMEVKIMVKKIVNYEKQSADPSWFNKMILIGGDSHDDGATGIAEGEYLCNYVYDHFMNEFTAVKIYASNKDTDPTMIPVAKNIVREISKGAGYVLFDGHGNPEGWNTHYPGNFTTWVGGINLFDFIFLHNGAKLPVIIVGGCHNSMFNNTLLAELDDKDNTHLTWVYGWPGPECFDWVLTHKIGAGGIATMGNTGLGYGTVGENGDIDGDGVNDPDCVEGLEGYQIRMFYQTVDSGVHILGDVWSATLTHYLTTFPAMGDQADCKTVQEWPILGDPTLMIGGYSS